MRFKFKLRLRDKMIIFILSAIIVIFGLVETIVGTKLNGIIKEFAFDYGISISEKYANELLAELNQNMGVAKTLSYTLNGIEKIDSTTRARQIRNAVLKNIENNDNLVMTWFNTEMKYTDPTYNKDYGRESISAFINEGGESELMIQYKDLDGHNEGSLYYDIKTEKKIVAVEPYVDTYGGKDVLMTSLCVPMLTNGNFVGLAGVDISLEHFNKVISEIDLFKGNEIITIISNEGTIIGHTDKNLTGKKLLEEFPELRDQMILQKVRKGQRFSFITEKDGYYWFSAFAPILIDGTKTPWSFEITIPVRTILAKARKTIAYSIIAILFSLALIVGVILVIARNITRPVGLATHALKQLSTGNIDVNQMVNIKSGDEIEEMGDSVNRVIEGLNRTEQFAREIEKGNLDAEYNLLGENDSLGHALLSMRESLKTAHKLETERKAEEEKKNWTTHGVAKFSEILRQDNDDLEKLSLNIISGLVKYVGAIQGGLFLLNDNDRSDEFIEMMSCYAYDRKKFMEKRIEVGEGLIGRCFIEKKTIYLTDVPNSYVNITSGLGKDNPSCILIVPLVLNEKVYGVIEIASFKLIEDYQIEFIEKIGESIASTVSSVRINVRTANLLEQTQQQAEEMAAQEEEMRQNMEELQATQEEASRREEELRKEVEELRMKLGE